MGRHQVVLLSLTSGYELLGKTDSSVVSSVESPLYSGSTGLECLRLTHENDKNVMLNKIKIIYLLSIYSPPGCIKNC